MAASAPPLVERATGKYERLAWERHQRDLALAYPDGVVPMDRELARTSTQHPKGFWFDPEDAQRPITFFETFCRHSKGEWRGQLILLEDWQQRILGIVFGWKRADGTRRFRIAYIEIARKNSKSTMGAGVGLYLTAADDEPGAEVYSSATKKDQAKIVHDSAVAMVQASPELKREVRTFRNNLHVPQLGSKFEPLGADSSTMDGLSPHGNIIDELHAHRNRDLWDVMDTAMGARRQPLTWAITTAGLYDPESIGWLQHQHAMNVLDGIIEDDAFFGIIFAADEEDDWQDPQTWAKANPNIGVSVKPDYLEGQCRKAQQQPSFLNTFLRLHLGRWTQQRDRWINIEQWNACDPVTLTAAEYEARLEALAGATCYGGLDLSSKLDLSALVLLFPDTWDLFCRFYCPEATVLERSKRDRVPYDAWARDGWLVATPGNTIDYDYIERDILGIHDQPGVEDVPGLCDRFQVEEIAFDPYNATQLATHLSAGGITMVEVRQGFQSLSEPSKEFEANIVNGKFRHGGHPVLRWNVANVAAREDVNANIMPDKGASGGGGTKAAQKNRIDGVSAAIMALSRVIVDPGEDESMYTDGMIFV